MTGPYMFHITVYMVMGKTVGNATVGQRLLFLYSWRIELSSDELLICIVMWKDSNVSGLMLAMCSGVERNHFMRENTGLKQWRRIHFELVYGKEKFLEEKKFVKKRTHLVSWDLRHFFLLYRQSLLERWKQQLGGISSSYGERESIVQKWRWYWNGRSVLDNETEALVQG